MSFTNKILFKRSSSNDSSSFAATGDLDLGEIALSVNKNNPGLYFETVDNQGANPSVVKLSPVYIGNSEPSGLKSNSDLWFDANDDGGTLKVRVNNAWKDCIDPPDPGAQTNVENTFTAKQIFAKDVELTKTGDDNADLTVSDGDIYISGGSLRLNNGADIESSNGTRIKLASGARITDATANTTVSDINYLRIDNQLTIANDKDIVLGGSGEITLAGTSKINVTGTGVSAFAAITSGAITASGKVQATELDIRAAGATNAVATIDTSGDIDARDIEGRNIKATNKFISNENYQQKVVVGTQNATVLNWNDGDFQTRTFTASATLTFSGTANDSNYARALVFELIIPSTASDDVSITWPTNVYFPNGVEYNAVPALEKGKRHLFVFVAVGSSTSQRYFGSYLTGFSV